MYWENMHIMNAESRKRRLISTSVILFSLFVSFICVFELSLIQRGLEASLKSSKATNATLTHNLYTYQSILYSSQENFIIATQTLIRISNKLSNINNKIITLYSDSTTNSTTNGTTNSTTNGTKEDSSKT